MKLLVASGEHPSGHWLRDCLEREGYWVVTVDSGARILAILEKVSCDLMVMDLQMDRPSTTDLIRSIRQRTDMPVVVLSSGGKEALVSALDSGADDFLEKPYEMEELKARIKAILRRTSHHLDLSDTMMTLDKFTINPIGRRIVSQRGEVHLTAKEFDLLLLLMMHPMKVFTREALLKNIWGYERYGELRTVDVHIRRLREKIEEDASKPRHILTRRGGRISL
ncbi:MAG: hypothetical protein AVO33_00050 [delta proteobacterium ML8_F1]|nr:MAG: hypothetical protein AVO33_00050 [delta proteobacterium ML8_F1]